MSARRALTALVLVTGLTPRVAAQTTSPRRVEVAGGVRLAGTTSFPEVPVLEATPSGGQRTVFVTRSRIEPSISGDVRIAVSLFRGLAVEAGVAVGNATLATTIDDDIELGSSVTVRESLRQYLLEGGLRFSPAKWRGTRWTPFVAAGGGYLRQLHEGRTLLETGRTVYVGGGARLFLTSPRSSGVLSGLRFDLRGTLVRGGISVDNSSRLLPVAHAAYFLQF